MTHSEILGRDPGLAEVVRRLVAAYEPLQTYLYGFVPFR